VTHLCHAQPPLAPVDNDGMQLDSMTAVLFVLALAGEDVAIDLSTWPAAYRPIARA